MLLRVLMIALCLSACGPVQFAANEADHSSLTPDPSSQSPSVRDVHYNNLVTAADNKLDIVLVIDDSNSMLPDNQKLADNLDGFVTKLQNSNIDWQMCATTTRALPISETQTAWGASVYWQNSTTPTTTLGMVLKKGTPNLSTIFRNTIDYINAGWQGSDDERGIKAAYRHVYNGDLRYPNNNGCYREDSAVAYIIISDEDERSIGGDASQQVYANELKPLEDEDKPEVFVANFRETFGATRRMTVNSIIVKPGDVACKAQQDTGSALSHYGYKYAELSQLTGGGIGSICESEFSKNLNLFIDHIQNSLSSIPLECEPVDGYVKVSITPHINNLSSRIEGLNLIFQTPVTEGHTVDLRYQCYENRSPSSAAKAIPYKEEGFFTRIISFIKSFF